MRAHKITTSKNEKMGFYFDIIVVAVVVDDVFVFIFIFITSARII